MSNKMIITVLNLCESHQTVLSLINISVANTCFCIIDTGVKNTVYRIYE